MKKLIIKSQEGIAQEIVLNRNLMNVGSSPSHEVFVSLEGVQKNALYFTLVSNEGALQIVPGEFTLRLNGKNITRPISLENCDQIQVDLTRSKTLTCVYVDALSEVAPQGQQSGSKNSISSLDVLSSLATSLHLGDRFEVQAALNQALHAVVEMANAESGYLLSEVGSDSAWELIAESTALDEDRPEPSRKQILSDTLIQDAITRREPVYIENIIGHPMSAAESVIISRIFSAYCAPLMLEGRIFGVLCLLTRSPGRSIRKEVLPELRTVAMLISLLMATRKEIRRDRTLLQALDEEVPNDSSLKKELGIFIGQSRPMEQLYSKIRKLAPTDLSLLVTGETGTGKELVAQAIHECSQRSKKPFVSINCAAIPATLLESTLFGHERGAFTGAVKAQQGKFVQAHGGTLFLDEIGDLSLDLQAKLLRALQERKVEPLGSTKSLDVDVRVVSATHRDLVQAVREGKFREDLYYRLNGATIHTPPLRDREKDVLLLARFFLKSVQLDLDFTADAQELLLSHSWPGNVRELEQTVRRSAYMADGDRVSAKDLEIGPSLRGALPGGGVAGAGDLFSATGGLEEAKQAFTVEYAKTALRKADGNRARAAAMLGISERTLYRILSGAGD